MVELEAASVERIHEELKRREMVARNVKIKDLFLEIDCAYRSGRIASISTETKNKGTSVEVISYHVFIG
jgi:hypothetical protein